MGRNKVKPEQALYGAFEVKHIFYTCPCRKLNRADN